MLLIVFIGTGLINCDGLIGTGINQIPPQQAPNQNSEVSSHSILSGDCCSKEEADIICVNQSSDKSNRQALDIALAYIHNQLQDTSLVTATASFRFLSFGNKAILPACMRKFNMNGIYSFFPPNEEACHSPVENRDKCLKVQEHWVKSQERNSFVKCFPISKPKDGNPTSSVNPHICLDGKETF